jgi:hypothetical protein
MDTEKTFRRIIPITPTQEIFDGEFKTNLSDDEQSKFKECIKLAKELKKNIYRNQMTIAEIVEQAYFIFRNGCIPLKMPQKRAELTRYHKDRFLYIFKKICKLCCFNAYTVSRWIVIKNYIYSELTEDQKEKFNYSAAEKVYVDLQEAASGDTKRFERQKVQEAYLEYKKNSKKVIAKVGLKHYYRFFTQISFHLVENKWIIPPGIKVGT